MKNDHLNDPEARDSIKALFSKARKKADFQRVQCIWLRAELQMNAEMVGKITRLKPGTVRKIWSDYLRKGESTLFEKDRGGRRNSHLSREEEVLFLEPYFRRVSQGMQLEVSELQQAYEKHINKKVPKSTVYRLLSRHGWIRKAGTSQLKRNQSKTKTDMHEYWIEGCAQVLHPENTGSISQQWLNQTLNSMVSSKSP